MTGPATWEVTRESYAALFEGRTRTLTIPSTVAEMTEIADQGKLEWSSSELVSLGSSLSAPADTDDAARVRVVFLNGTFEGNQNVLGVHISGSPYAFIFKDRTLSVVGTPATKRYVEQAVVIHEIRHAIGLGLRYARFA